MRTIAPGSSFRLLLVPALVLLALACKDITPPEPARVTGPVTAPPTPDYSLMLGDATVSAPRGWHGSITTLRLDRTNFTGAVALRVENLPTGVSVGLPQGFFSSASLGLYVASDAPTGTFTNVLIRGVAPGLADRTTPLTLIITEAAFTVTLSSAVLTMELGDAALTTTVNVIRHNFRDPVTLAVDTDAHGSMPPGITGAWEPNPVTGDSSVLTLLVSGSVVPGVYHLWVWAYTSTMYDDGTLLTVTVTAPAGAASR